MEKAKYIIPENTDLAKSISLKLAQLKLDKEASLKAIRNGDYEELKLKAKKLN